MPGQSRKKKSKWTQEQLNFLTMLQEKEEVRERVRVMLMAQQSGDSWRGLVATPAGTLLDKVVSAFRQSTDIPLEIPFFVTFHLLSAELLKRDIVADFTGRTVRPDLWTIILGESGSGKTYTTDEIMKVTGVDDTFPEAASTARFVMELAEHNKALWVRDEIGQFLKNMEEQSYLTELKDVLLRVYDGKRIERKTKKDEVVVDDPALTILGLTVYSTFTRIISSDSLLDGFAQRFSYVIAKADPERPAIKYPIYDLRPYRAGIKAEWDAVIQRLPENGTVYKISESGVDAFRVGFETLMPPQEQVPLSFFRRIMFRGVRYALLYHVFLHKTSTEIDDQDMAWAGRLAALHIKDAAELISETGGGIGSKLYQLVRKAETLRDKLAAEGKPLKPRDLVANIREIETAGQARGILSMLNALDEEQ